MFRSLGDFILISNVAARAKKRLEDAEVVIFHRNNPYLKLMNKDYLDVRLFKASSLIGIIRMIFFLRRKRKDGFRIFGLQQAPGSLLGFLALSGLKKLRAADYVVDFNLADADIITFPKASFVFDRHLRQLEDIFHFKFKEDDFKLELPFRISDADRDFVDRIFPNDSRPLIALHPWSGRRNSHNHAWGSDSCLELVRLLNNKFPEAKIAILGKDKNKEPLSGQISNVAKDGSFLVLPQLTVPQLAYLFKRITVLVTVNSGPMHLAMIQKTKMVVLSGPSLDIWNPPDAADIRVVKPRGNFFPPAEKEERDRIFSAVSDIRAEDVFNALCELTLSTLGAKYA